MSDEKKPTVQTRDMNRWIKGILMVGLVIIVVAVIAKSFGVSGISGFGGYTKTLEIEVTTLKPHQLCGVRPGERKFTIPYQRHVSINGDDYDVTSYVRVNKSLPNETFEVDDDGCVAVSFAFNSKALGLPINPQVIAITFK